MGDDMREGEQAEWESDADDLQSRKESVKRILSEVDRDHSGTIEPDEFKECLPLLHVYTTDEDADFLAKHFDTNGDGKLRIEEILDNLHLLTEHAAQAQQLKEAFQLIDRDRNGYIRQRELLRVLIYNDFMTVPDARLFIKTLLKRFDKDGDEKFNYAEFVEMWKSPEYQETVAVALRAVTDGTASHDQNPL